jgi:hypothetical protein
MGAVTTFLILEFRGKYALPPPLEIRDKETVIAEFLYHGRSYDLKIMYGAENMFLQICFSDSFSFVLSRVDRYVRFLRQLAYYYNLNIL